MLYHEEYDQYVEGMGHPAPTENFNQINRVKIVIIFYLNTHSDQLYALYLGPQLSTTSTRILICISPTTLYLGPQTVASMM